MIWLWKKEKINKELIEYAEQEAKVLAAFQIDCRVVLEHSRDVLINILLGGAGGALALAVSLFDKSSESWLFYGVSFTSFYLFLLCSVLVLWNRDVKFITPPGFEPKGLYNDTYKHMNISEIREMYLKTRQQVIEDNRKDNRAFGEWIDRIRLFAAITPLWLVIAYLMHNKYS